MGLFNQDGQVSMKNRTELGLGWKKNMAGKPSKGSTYCFFPGGPVVEKSPCTAGDAGLTPAWGTKIPTPQSN